MKNELWEAAKLKASQLENEIRMSTALKIEKSNMLHTFSKLWMFATDAWDHEVLRKASTSARADVQASERTPSPASADPEERQYIEGSRMALRSMLGFVLGQLAGDGVRNPAANFIAEREDIRRVLRDLCSRHGDNDWPDDLHLGDVLDKHLGRYLDAKEDD